ncbi:MAG: RNA-protein complex protein Nop10 [Candidatus Thermoplasmatota archaeon]|nr:RNA-protein complex protein Nop10 [Candidatus Thermoplasmatota archaeon]
MRSRIKRCNDCRTYTLKDQCPKCGLAVINTFPPRYSPEDRYGKYRRMARYGNGTETDGKGGVQ